MTTSQAAQWVGLPDRGALKPGLVADVALFDLEHLDAQPKEEAADLPGGATRWIQRASGVPYVFVNGEPTVWESKDTDTMPGRVLRSSAYE